MQDKGQSNKKSIGKLDGLQIVGAAVELVFGVIELLGNSRMFGGFVAILGSLFLVITLGISFLALWLTESEDKWLSRCAKWGSSALLILGLIACVIWYMKGTEFEAARISDEASDKQALAVKEKQEAASSDYQTAMAGWRECLSDPRPRKCGPMPTMREVQDIPIVSSKSAEVSNKSKEELRTVNALVFALAVGLLAVLIGIKKGRGERGLRVDQKVERRIETVVDEPMVKPFGSIGPLPYSPVFGPPTPPFPQNHPRVVEGGTQGGSFHPKPTLTHPTTHPEATLATTLPTPPFAGTYPICNGEYKLTKRKDGGWNLKATHPDWKGEKIDLYMNKDRGEEVLLTADWDRQDDLVKKFLIEKGKVRPLIRLADREG